MATVTTKNLDDVGTADAVWRSWLSARKLRAFDTPALLSTGRRIVVVAPHPDDELLGAGGLIAQASEIGHRVLIISVTNGTSSHPGSTLWPRDRLNAVRPWESMEGLNRLRANDVSFLRLQLQDSEVAQAESALTLLILRAITADDLIISTWREDGHPDHDATGRATAKAAVTAGATHIEVPIWAWHWATPGDPRVPWRRAMALPLSADVLARKRWAIEAHRSQLENDDTSGRPAIISPETLEYYLRPFEVYFV